MRPKRNLGLLLTHNFPHRSQRHNLTSGEVQTCFGGEEAITWIDSLDDQIYADWPLNDIDQELILRLSSVTEERRNCVEIGSVYGRERESIFGENFQGNG